jgi:hypothetical protein
MENGLSAKGLKGKTSYMGNVKLGSFFGSTSLV